MTKTNKAYCLHILHTDCFHYNINTFICCKIWQKLVGEATINEVTTGTENSGTKPGTNETVPAETEEAEEEVPPRKKLRLEKKLRNAEFLFRRRKRDICGKMRQHESEWNKVSRENNSLQQQVSTSFYI